MFTKNEMTLMYMDWVAECPDERDGMVITGYEDNALYLEDGTSSYILTFFSGEMVLHYDGTI